MGLINWLMGEVVINGKRQQEELAKGSSNAQEAKATTVAAPVQTVQMVQMAQPVQGVPVVQPPVATGYADNIDMEKGQGQ